MRCKSPVFFLECGLLAVRPPDESRFALLARRDALLSLLRRFAVEAARDEARMLCHDLVARPVMPSYRLAAA